MSSKNHLNPQQIEKLQKALKKEEKGNIREKVLILLLLKDGKTQYKIAEFLGYSVNKVSYWCLEGYQGYFILNKILSVLRLKPALRCA